MGKKQRIERLERMLSGSNGEVQTYEPYKGVFADLEEHHSRLKAVEHDVPGLAGEIDLLLRRVIKLEQATDPKVKLNVESFPFIASTADVEDVPGAGEVTSETHLWQPKELAEWKARAERAEALLAERGELESNMFELVADRLEREADARATSIYRSGAPELVLAGAPHRSPDAYHRAARLVRSLDREVDES